jgi:hypothetical protein
MMLAQLKRWLLIIIGVIGTVGFSGLAVFQIFFVLKAGHEGLGPLLLGTVFASVNAWAAGIFTNTTLDEFRKPPGRN